jgi:C1A family cysteine protease
MILTTHPSSRLINGKQRHLSGWKCDRPDHRDLLFSAPVSRTPAPTAADNSAGCSPVEDQGDIGSCVGNSTTSALEYLLIKQKRPLVELSRLFLYFFTRKMERTPPTEDSGCQIRDAVRCVAKLGTCRESLWPYIITQFSVQPSLAAQADAKDHRATQYLRCMGLASLKATIAAGYTAVGGFSVPENMMNDECAKTGIVKFPAPKEQMIGGHAVHFVGYDDATQRLKFQNSWGAAWGDKGFGYLEYDFATKTPNLLTDVWTIRAET